ncbi:hypothetical protein ACFLV2_00015 [Chloroflexota bacterium]
MSGNDTGRLRMVARELKEHVPFTAVGAVTGIVLMVILNFTHLPRDVSSAFFHTLHPLHVVLSALVTTAMYRQYGNKKLWVLILVGYTGSVGIATLSDLIIPYLGGVLLNIPMEFHLPFLETEKIPYIGIETWIAVNSAAVIGIAIAYFKPTTRFPHMGHVLLSTWASLFSFMAFGMADWIPLLPFIFIFLFLSVWIPCCLSDIVYPLLWVGKVKGSGHTHHH